MLGLLAKAAHLRRNLGLPVEGREEFAFDPESGISREDQKEILREIEKVAKESRIAVTPEAFAVKAAKRGVLFPVIVNAAAVLALVAGFFVFQLSRISSKLPLPVATIEWQAMQVSVGGMLA